jgi:dUTP pyrophosphatase
MANSVGVIDSSYRGEIMAPLESRTDFTVGDHHGTLKLLQIVAPDLKPIKVVVVEADELGETARGEGSFGSTNAR